jgi:hypothetical protein
LENNGLNVWPTQINYYIKPNLITQYGIRRIQVILVLTSKNMGEFSCATLSELGNGVRGGITSGGGIHRIEGGYHRRGGLATEKVIGPKNKLVQINLITIILTTPILAENNL